MAQEHFWEGPYPTEQALLADKAIQHEAEKLKDEGRQFELTEDSSEYILRVKGFEGITHITKVNDPRNVDIKTIIIDQVRRYSQDEIV